MEEHVPVMVDIEEEFVRATSKFKPFKSAHEGYAVVLEEIDELWDVVKLNQGNPERVSLMRKEAIQVAAMALRFVVDCCDKPTDELVEE